MSTSDDDPVDGTAVAYDDELIEHLRRSLSPDSAVVWDDEDLDLDPGYALLRAVQLDVSADLPVDAPIVPDGVIELAPRRRQFGRGATVAAIAAGVLSIGGVAAAAAPGHPLSGVRSAVASAVHNVLDAITPNTPVGPAVANPTHSAGPSERASASPRSTPPGEAISSAARSASAIEQITADLDRAEALIADGRVKPAKEQLDAAERKLPYVTDAATHDALASRLAGLRARLATVPTPKPDHGQPADKGSHSDNGSNPDKGSHSGKGSHSAKVNSGQGRSGANNDGGNASQGRPTSPPSTSTHASTETHGVKPTTPASDKGTAHS